MPPASAWDQPDTSDAAGAWPDEQLHEPDGRHPHRGAVSDEHGVPRGAAG